MFTNSVQTNTTLSGSDLKILACVSMFIDHFAAVFDLTGPAELLLRHLIGRLAFPIFAFLLAEGFLHTRNLKRYFAGLFLLALLSEIPYDLAFSGSSGLLPECTQQNTLFTLSLGLLMLYCIKKTEALLLRRASVSTLIFPAQLLVILLFAAAAWLLHLDYSFLGPACIGAMYLFRANRFQAALAGCACLNLDFLSMPGAFLAVLPLSRYNGTRGKQRKYLFYLFYPLHLLLLVLLRQCLGSVLSF